MVTMDFSVAKMAHMTWRLKLRSFLDGKETLDSQHLASHQDCELGKWIYSEGMKKYGQNHDMTELEIKHKAMHALVKRIVELKQAGKVGDAEQEFTKVHGASEDVVKLLTRLEAQMK